MSLEREEQLKLRGMAQAAASNTSQLRTARILARRIASRVGVVSADDIREEAKGSGVKFVWGNWAGSIFKTPDWSATGRFVKATHEGSRARMVREWRYVGTARELRDRFVNPSFAGDDGSDDLS